MNQLFVPELEEATEAALVHRRATAKYSKAFRHYFNTIVEPLEADRFWQILEQVYRPLVIARINRDSVVKDSAHELFRGCMYDNRTPTISFDDLIRFARSWEPVRKTAYQPLFEVVEGRGDDGYGDLLDSLVLVGREVHEACVRRDYGNNDVFERNVTEALHSAVDDFVNARKNDPWSNWNDERTQGVKDKLVGFVLHGENYNAMRLEEAASYWFASKSVDDFTKDKSTDEFNQY